MSARTTLILSLVVGATIGMGTTLLSFGSAGSLLGPKSAALPQSADQQPPRLVVDGTEHDFGGVEVESTVRHAFRFTNEGPGILRLKSGTTSCSACTIAKLEKSELLPGESTDIVVEYTAGRLAADFLQTATVLTNDPDRPRVELSVLGAVTDKFLAVPSSFAFGNVTAGETATATCQFFYLLKGDMKIEGHEFENADTADLFDLKIEPIDSAQLTEHGASSGNLLVLSLKPGLPLGAFVQTIRLAISLDGVPSQRSLTAEGAIVSDLSLVGPGWREDQSLLSLGTARSDQGLKRTLRVLVRGETREQVQLVTERVEPAAVRVTIGERSKLNDNVDQIPLEVEIPPGAPPMVYLGTQQWPLGEIVLGVRNHPEVKELRLRLKFAIQ